MRERLIKLIREAKDEYQTVPTINCCKAEFANFLADRLLENAVIVPPCKMGDILYRVVTMGNCVQRRIIRHKHSGMTKMLQYETKKNFIRKIVVSKNNFLDVCENFGKTVFSTKEEAKQALKGVTDMPRYIDADALYRDTEKKITESHEYRTAVVDDEFLDIINDAFTEDVVEVVRCKDCAVPHNEWTGCPNLNGLIPPPDFYCARGERKEKKHD